MRLAREMPGLLDDSNYAYTHNLGLEAALAYLSAPEEVKAEVDERLAIAWVRIFRGLRVSAVWV
jgi:hypothetical protein